MKNDLELYVILSSLVMVDILLFFINLNLILILLFILINFTLLINLIIYFKRKKVQYKMIKQAKEIINGNLNRRILVKNNRSVSVFALLFNEMTEKLQKQKIKNLKSEESRKRFLSNISHDIRTPLTSLLGYVEVLREDENINKERRNEYYNILINKAKNLKEMIDEIFQMARIESDDYDFHFKKIDLAEILRNSIIDYLTRFENKDMDIDIEVPEEVCKIYGDKYSIERIVGNIIKNSIEHGKEGGYIAVKMNIASDGYTILISDKGPGINKDELSHIFDRLYEGKENKKNSSHKSGLGLSIAKKLIEIHNGEIDIKSKPYELTTVKLFFPKASY